MCKNDKDVILAYLEKFYSNKTLLEKLYIAMALVVNSKTNIWRSWFTISVLNTIQILHGIIYGKGVVDGVRDKAKCFVHQLVLSKTRNVIIQNATDFAIVCKGTLPNVTLHLIEQEHLSKAQQLNLWDHATEIKGMSKTHHAVFWKMTSLLHGSMLMTNIMLL